MERHPTELDIAGYPVDVTIENNRYNVEIIVIPTYDVFMKNMDNTDENYQKIKAGLTTQLYIKAHWVLVEELGVEGFYLTHKDRMEIAKWKF